MTLPRTRRILSALAAAALAAAALTTPALTTPAHAATGGTFVATGDHLIAGDYVVALDDAAARRAPVPATAARLAAEFGGTVGFTYEHGLRGFQFRGDAAAARRLAARPGVRYVAQSHLMRAAGGGSQSSPVWGLDRTDQRKLPLDKKYSYPTDGTGVTAYIVDTGIHFTHTEFGGRAVKGLDVITEGGDAKDCHSHGTHVAGTVGGKTYGIAKNVKLVAVRVLDCNGSGPDAGVAKAIDWITANATGPSVVNMSIGGDPFAPIDDAMTAAMAKGVHFAVAAGNGDAAGRPQDACNYTPARVGGAVTVAASDTRDRSASFTNYGKCVDIYGPGVGVKSATHTSNTATGTKDGTSMATPHVAGVMAAMLEKEPTLTPQQLHDAVAAAATPGVITGAGSNTPNKLLYLGAR
ncbi:hypothetical protein GCM10010124_23790 [Pilimelia terevasa]|uniref:Peptidase S8/S53 domain-containing protein n=1 Tax=Pilimelia terevasa TaxID=53372 RepID=A0A8J3BR28_9ACTN|nr:S8 family peptidase [Pilimelia terevasa]GGK30281.1 hypothetical protein GCM10010124_23790 [Pilimelia terevasa]